MKKRFWVLIIGSFILVFSLIFKVVHNVSRSMELGHSKVSFKFSNRDTSYLLHSTIGEIGSCFTMQNRKGRESGYWL